MHSHLSLVARISVAFVVAFTGTATFVRAQIAPPPQQHQSEPQLQGNPPEWVTNGCGTSSLPCPPGTPPVTCDVQWNFVASDTTGLYQQVPGVSLPNNRFWSSCWGFLPDFLSLSNQGIETRLDPPYNQAPMFGEARAHCDSEFSQSMRIGGVAYPLVYGIHGFPLNLSLTGIPALGDFVPPSPSIGGSSLPLVDSAARNTPTSMEGMARPTLEGAVDLVTGSQLAQVSDLQLPISGGTFRLNRTRVSDRQQIDNGLRGAPDRWWDWTGDGWMSSENPILLIDSALPDVVGSNARVTYLVLDAFHSIPFQFIESNGTYEAPPRFRARLAHNGLFNNTNRSWSMRPTRFEIDLYDGAVQYVFHAVGTVVDPNANVPNDEHFVPDDVPPSLWNVPDPNNPPPFANMVPDSTKLAIGSFHDRPLLGDGSGLDPFSAGHPGIGLPYYALCTEINTRGNSKAKIYYCGMTQYNLTKSISNQGNGCSNCSVLTPLCPRCLQTCPSKGQISKVEVYSDNVLQWTLLYHYRIAGASMEVAQGGGCYNYHQSENQLMWDQYQQAYGRRVVNRIYAFKNTPVIEAQLSALGDALCIPARFDFDHDCDLAADTAVVQCLDRSPEPVNSNDAIRTNADSTGHEFSEAQRSAWAILEQKWSAQVQYSYGLYGYEYQLNDCTNGSGPFPVWTKYILPPIPVLVKTTSLEKEVDEGVESARSSRRVFAYQDFGTQVLGGVPYWTGNGEISLNNYPRTSLLVAIFEEGDIARAVHEFNTSFATLSRLQTGAAYSIPSSSLASQWSVNDVALKNFEGAFPEQVLACASKRWLNQNVLMTNSSETFDAPSFSTLQSANYLRGVGSSLVPTNEDDQGRQSSCHVLAAADAGGQSRVYRINRVAILQAGTSLVSSPGTGGSLPSLWQTHRSKFFAPYQWRGYENSGGNASVELAPADHRAVRWISIIDEFVPTEGSESGTSYSRTAWQNANENTYGGTYGTKPGQASRRVVEVSGAGIVLRDTTWHFDPNNPSSPTVTGGGLGEEFIYEKVSAIFAETSLSFPEVGTLQPPDPNPFGEGPIDPVSHLRNEVVLVEHRSAGWAAARYGTNGSVEAGNTTGLVTAYDYEPYIYCKTPPTPPQTCTTTGLDWYVNKVIALRPKRQWIQSGRAYFEDSFTASGGMQRNTAPMRLFTSHDAWHDPNVVIAAGSQGYEVDTQVAYTDGPTAAQGNEVVTLPSNFSQAPHPNYTKMRATHTLTWRRPQASGTNADVRPLIERQVASRMVIGPPRQQRPGSSTWYYPIEREWYDETGAMVWSASGLVVNPLNPAATDEFGEEAGVDLQTLTFTCYVRDSYGRPLATIVDMEPTSIASSIPVVQQHRQYLGDQIPIPPIPSENGGHDWPRLPSASSPTTYTNPLEYVTGYAYNNPGQRLSDIFFPNGRRWASRVVMITNEEREIDPTTSICQTSPVPADCACCLCPQSAVTSSTLLTESMRTTNSDPQFNNCIKYKDSLRWNSGVWSPGANQQQYYENNTGTLPRDKWFAREYIFTDLERMGTDGQLQSRMLGEIKDYNSTDLSSGTRVVRRVYFATESNTECGAIPVDIDLDLQAFNQPRFIEEAQVKLGVDARGRIVDATLLEPNDQGALQVIGTKEVNDLLDIYREREIDGTTTRTTRNRFGQSLLQFVGTQDVSWSSGQYASSYVTDNNLVLTARKTYGTSPKDAWLPTMTRRYTSHPSWAEDAQNFYGKQPALDTEGYATRTEYDWRMRPVKVVQYGETSDGIRDPDNRDVPIVSTQITLLDHADRPVIQVVYGEGLVELPEHLDPAMRTPTDDALPLPSATAYLESGLQTPLSLVETRYGNDGAVISRRTYNVENPAEYHEEHMLNGRGGVEIYSQRPGQPVSKSVVDGLGRLVSTKQMAWVPGSTSGGAWSMELSRTDLGLDADGNVVDTRSLERVSSGVLLANDNVLSASSAGGNAVRRRSVAWYDPKKRNVASADLGTEDAGGKYVAADAGYSFSPLHEPKVVCNGPNGKPALQQPNGGPSASDNQVSVSHYDLLTGRLTLSANPDGTITRHEYDKAGRLVKKTENYSSVDVSQKRVTEYGYKFGRLITITAYGGHGATQPTNPQTSTVHYGADVLAEVGNSSTGKSYELASRRNDLIGKMSLPKPDNGNGSEEKGIVLRYTFDGNIAERIDPRGVAFRYFYDALGRLSQVVVGRYYDLSTMLPGDFVAKYPEAMTLSSGAPLDRVGHIRYVYNSRGQLSDVIASTNASGDVISHNHYLYDLRGNLLSETQRHGKQIPEGDDPTQYPTVSYAWAYQPTAVADGTPKSQIGFDRLTSITYPQFETEHRRVVEMSYGAPGSTSNIISRLQGMRTHLHNGTSMVSNTQQDVAAFQYFGVGRRFLLELGHGNAKVTQNLRTSVEVGANGLDKFGRVIDLHYKNTLTSPTAQSTMFRAEYGYSVHGTRTFAKLTQAAVGSTTFNDVRSQFNLYNKLGQLTATVVGSLGSNPENEPTSFIRKDTWGLDLLGNWNAGIAAPSGGTLAQGGRVSTGNVDGNFNSQLGLYDDGNGYGPWSVPGADIGNDYRALSHAMDRRNEIDNVSKIEGNVGATGPPTSNTTTQYQYDAAGNLLYDGTYIYQYDAWNRLVQINRAKTNTALPITASTPIDVIVKHFTYDGMGRLIRTQSPYPSPDYVANEGDIRSERFYYDGSRRIQEVVLDPATSLAMAMMSGEVEIASEAAASASAQASAVEGEEIDLSASSMAFEAEVTEGEPQAMSGGGSEPIPQIDEYRLEREYIWGPGDGFAGVDELFVMFDRERAPWLVLQDASGDVAALCGRIGNTNNGISYVAAQWTWDAYGNVFSADHITSHPLMRVGHKGLFVERLDAGVADPTMAGAEIGDTPRLVPFAQLVYHNRNRSYNPQLGRFLQADPNASGMVVGGMYRSFGQRPRIGQVLIDFQLRMADGGCLYQYVRSDPWRFNDPLGLYAGEDAWDDATALAGLLDPLPGPSDMIRSVLNSMISEYARRLEDDSYWASNWDASDDGHSRLDSLWVLAAIGEGLYDAFDVDLPFTDATINPIDYVAARQKGSSPTAEGRGAKGNHKWKQGGAKARHRNLSALGLITPDGKRVQLRNATLKQGESQLTKLGFRREPPKPDSDRVSFKNDVTGIHAHYDPGSGKRSGTTSNHQTAAGGYVERSHWHIEGPGPGGGRLRYDHNGNVTNWDSRNAHH